MYKLSFEMQIPILSKVELYEPCGTKVTKK